MRQIARRLGRVRCWLRGHHRWNWERADYDELLSTAYSRADRRQHRLIRRAVCRDCGRRFVRPHSDAPLSVRIRAEIKGLRDFDGRYGDHYSLLIAHLEGEMALAEHDEAAGLLPRR